VALACLLLPLPALLLLQLSARTQKDGAKDVGFSYPSSLPSHGRTASETLAVRPTSSLPSPGRIVLKHRSWVLLAIYHHRLTTGVETHEAGEDVHGSKIETL